MINGNNISSTTKLSSMINKKIIAAKDSNLNGTPIGKRIVHCVTEPRLHPIEISESVNLPPDTNENSPNFKTTGEKSLIKVLANEISPVPAKRGSSYDDNNFSMTHINSHLANELLQTEDNFLANSNCNIMVITPDSFLAYDNSKIFSKEGKNSCNDPFLKKEEPVLNINPNKRISNTNSKRPKKVSNNGSNLHEQHKTLIELQVEIN
jgi:hypothetical protein